MFPLHSQKIYSKKFSIDNGLLSTDNYRVYQDKEHYIWIASERGITKFDGYNFTYFTTKEGLKTNDVWEVIIDSKNRKWLRYFGNGIQYIENDKVKTIKGSEKLGQFHYVGEYQDTAFFIREDRDKSQMERYYLARNNQFGRYSIDRSNGKIMVGDFRGFGFQIIQLNDGSKHYISNLHNGSLVEIDNIIVSSVEGGMVRENERIVKHRNKFYYFFESEFKEFEISKITKLPIQFVRYDYVSNYIFVQTQEYHYVFKNIESKERDYRVEKILNFSNDLKGKKIEYVFVDRERNTWVVEHRGEVYFFPFNSVWYKDINANGVTAGNAICPLKIDHSTFFINRPNLLHRYEENAPPKLVFTNKNSVRDIGIGNSHLLVLTALDLYTLGSKQDRFSSDNSLIYHEKGNFKNFEFLNKHTVVLNNGMVYSLKENKVTNQFNFPNNATKVAVLDSVLVSSNDSELLIMDLKSGFSKTHRINDIKLLKTIDKYLVVGHENRLTFYTFVTVFREKSSIKFDDHVNDIVMDKDQIYIATDEGLLSTTLKSIGKEVKLSLLLKSKFYGFQINNVLVDEQKITLFTTKGVFEFSKNELSNFSNQRDLKFSVDLIANNKSVKNNSSLPFDQNTLKFKMTNVSYYNLGEVVYRYKLLGYNTEVKYTTDPYITFSNLKPGKYSLGIAISTSKSVGFQNEKVLDFEILPPYYYSIGFIVLVILVLVAFIWLVVYLTRRIIQRREARKLKLKDLELRALRAQLNPHFVFNCLNTIQSMIVVKSPQEANTYITSFADMIRGVLDSSRKEKVYLIDEIKFLEDYLTLEKSRLHGSLNYQVTWPPSLSIENIKVYTLVYQPIIENAIVHAYSHEQQNKQLFIRFEQFENMLMTTIEDNGIGIVQSLKKNAVKIRTSHSTMILNEKAALLNSINKGELTIEIIDLKESENRAGTKVIVKMRVQ